MTLIDHALDGAAAYTPTVDVDDAHRCLSTMATMAQSTSADRVLALLTSTVEQITPAISSWAGWRVSSGDVVQASGGLESHTVACPEVAVRSLNAWSPRLTSGHPPFEVAIDDTPLAGATRLSPTSSASVFPMSSGSAMGALMLATPPALIAPATRVLIELLCTHAATTLELVSARESGSSVDAMFGTMAQLTVSYTDPELVLRTIVRSAVRLLGTDAAHVMLADDDKKLLTVTTAYGITSKEFYRATCRTDELLPGAAIRTRRVVCVRDMALHEQAHHYQTEGIRSVMCAPMFVEDDLIGVLLVAHREVRQPSEAHRSLLGALASAAAISITNARLHEEHTRSIAELGEVNALLASGSAALERTLAFQRRATSLVLEGHGLDEIVRATCESTGGVIVIVDHDLTPLHSVSGSLAELGIDESALASTVASIPEGAPGSGLTEAAGSRADSPRTLLARVGLGHENSAYVVVSEGDRQFDNTDLGIIESAVTAIGLEFMRDRASAEAEARVTGGLFQALLADDGVDDVTILRRASYLGYELAGANVVVAVGTDEASHPEHLIALVRRAMRRASSVATFERNETVFVVASDAADLGSRHIAELCHLIEQEAAISGSRAKVRIAHAGPHEGVQGVRRGVRESAYALHVQALLGRTGHGPGFDQLGIWSLLGRIGDRRQLRDFAQGVLGPLIAYDEARGAELIPTLRELGSCNYHYREAAERLYAHPNTVRYRVARIAELANLDVGNAEDRLHIELALRVLDVLGTATERDDPALASSR